MAQPATLIVHQALHGYKDGHRLLASSLGLKGRDASKLLVMSDVSGPNAQIVSDGYLTGYPLLDCGLYALARTWPAPEMPRPGCVWTHTLLIDFADLAIIDSVTLIGSFRRPQPPDLTAYSGPIATSATSISGSRPSPFSFSTPWMIAPILVGLYERPDEKILVRWAKSARRRGLRSGNLGSAMAAPEAEFSLLHACVCRPISKGGGF